MIPILYNNTETEFDSNGLGRLRDCIECKVTEERNGIYEVEFQYPVDGANYDKIQLGRIIAVEHDYTNDVQPFDIVSCSKPINGVVTFRAVHISYRQGSIVARGSSISSLSDAFTMLRSGVPSNPFTYETDITSTAYMASADGLPHTVRSMLGGMEGSILDTYGGEYEWDKFRVILHASRGRARNLTIRYGVNLVDYTEDTDYSESYNAVVPFWSGEDTAVIGDMVSVNTATYNGRTDCVPLDLTDKFESQPTKAQVESMATSLLNSKQPYLAHQNITVNFIRLQDTDEYAQYASLFDCALCDTVRVVFPRYGMDGRFKIVKTVYNVLTERWDEIELGELQTTLAEALGISETTKTNTSAVVVEQGTSGIWTYRKWSNGTAECWGHQDVGSTAYSANGGYKKVEATLPSGLFITTPDIVIASGRITGTINTDMGFTSPNNASTIQTYLINRGGSAVTQTGVVYWNVKGKWK